MESFDSNALNPDAFRHLDDYVDNFSKIAHIPTDLMFGRPGEETPFLSVIIPTYSRDALFAEALESVLRQRAPGFVWEIVVMDNTPLDAEGLTPALRIVREQGGANVRYYHNRVNISSGYNWNRGVELARGEWVCFLHDDDLLCEDALYQIGKILYEKRYRGRLGYIQANMAEFSDSAEFRRRRFRQDRPIRLTRTGALLTYYATIGMTSCGTTILRKAYLESGGINYDFGPSADAVLAYKIMRKYRAIRSGPVLGGYRWSRNETLKKSTLQKLVWSDYLFAEYRYRASRFASLWGWAFGNVQHQRNLEKKLATGVRSGMEITEDELHLYVPPFPFPPTRRMEYLGVLTCYYSFRKMAGMLQNIKWR